MKKVVMIKWLDAESHADDRWLQLDEAIEYAKEEIQPCVSVGFLVAETWKHVAIATSNGHDQIGTIWKIPKGMILEQRVICELDQQSKTN